MKRIFACIAKRWSEEGGYRQLLAVAFPLILSTGSWSVQHFVDRMFLAWHSPEAVAASMPAGMLNFALVCLFIGTANFVGTFVAQYAGAQRHDRIGPSLWQGIYLSLIGGAMVTAAAPFSERIFAFIGHDPAVSRLEADYFRILCMGAFPVIGSSALSGFYIGRGKTWPVMWINVAATAVNVVFDYAMIFGHWGFPRMGMKGAAWATVLSACVNFLAYVFLVFGRPQHRRYRLGAFALDRELFGRLMKFGLPSGVQFLIDVAGFTAFILLMGRLGTVNLAATNIAFNINTLAFMPMIGIGIAVSTLVGQYIGAEKPVLAGRATWSGFHLTFLYMATIAFLYVAAPGLFIRPFASGSDPVRFAEIAPLTAVLLRFVAAYSIFDTMNIVFASAIKGAGDTRFVMLMIVVLSGFGLVLPTWLAIGVFGMGIMAGWTIATVYVSALGIAFLLRFLGGKWKSMKVIEETCISMPSMACEAPGTEFEP